MLFELQFDPDEWNRRAALPVEEKGPRPVDRLTPEEVEAAEGVEGAKVIWDGGYGMVQLALDGVRGMLYGRPDRSELWTLLARLDHPITWATGEFTQSWAFCNMLLAWTPEQCREFYAMLSRRPDFNPKAPNHEFSASEVDPSRCGLCLEHRRDHGTRPGGLRSIEQAAREYVEAHRKAGAVRFGAGSAEDAFDADATEDAAWTNLCVAVDGWTPDSQAPTAQSAPPPGPTSPEYYRQAIEQFRDEAAASRFGTRWMDDVYVVARLNKILAQAPPVEPPAPRPMKLDVIVSKFDSSKHLSHLQVTSVNRGGFAQTCPQEIAEEIAARLLAFEAPEAQAGEAP